MTENEYDEIKKLLVEAKIKTAVNNLVEKTKDTKNGNKAIELAYRLNQIEKEDNQGHITTEQRLIEQNRLISAILLFNDEIYKDSKNEKEGSVKMVPITYIILICSLLCVGYFASQFWMERNKIKDIRDGQKYVAITIDSLEWLAENMNIDLKNSHSWLYKNKKNALKDFGRLYDFEGANLACNGLGNNWRLPTKDEIRSLSNYLESGADIIFYNKFLGGESDNIGNFLYRGENGVIWSASKSKNDFVWIMYVHGFPKKVEIFDHNDKSYGYSCRCVRKVVKSN